MPEPEIKSPEQIAVALRFEPEKDAAPLIVATGKGTIASEIIKIAQENNIPLFEDRGLAQLLSKLQLDTQIPSELYVLVAEVLAFVYRLDRMASKRKKLEEKMTVELKKK
jgi:flagellar biosynthesis protein